MFSSRVMEGVRTMARPHFPRSLAEFRSRFVTEDDCRRYLVEAAGRTAIGVPDVLTPRRTS